MTFHKTLTKCPVTACCFISSNILLTGEAGDLSVYLVQSRRLLTSISLFKAANIHGIRSEYNASLDTYQLVVFGGKSFSILHLHTNPNISVEVVVTESELLDWIWDARLLKDQQQMHTSIAFALGHNSVIQYNIAEQKILDHIHCDNKCIIYCAHFMGATWADLLLAAGTVFNQVVLWTPATVNRIDSLSGNKIATIMHSLKGHEGVIFSIAFHSDLMQLCSVSDDRSVRVWRIDLPPGLTSPLIGQDLPVTSWQQATFTVQHVLYGHTARVWDVSILNSSYVSVGEDACCFVWGHNGTVTQKYKFHKGKSLWSLAVSADETVVATGGGDCGVCLCYLNDNADSDDNLPKSLTIDLHNKQVENDVFVRSVCLLNSDVVLVMTDSGSLYSYTISTKLWILLDKDENYSSYSLLQPSHCSDKFVLANIHGDVKLFANGEKYIQHIYESKVLSVLWVEGDQCLLTTGPNGIMDLWKIDYTVQPSLLARISLFLLPPTKQRWATCVCLVPHVETCDNSEPLVEPNLDINVDAEDMTDLCECFDLFVGDRGGSVYRYVMDAPLVTHKHDLTAPLEPRQRFHKVHGKAGVTNMCYRGNKLYTCGRDGAYAVYQREQNLWNKIHSIKTLKGMQWLSRMMFIDDDLIVAGFHTNNFMLYNVTTRQQFLSIPCGGGHRAWDFHMSCDHPGSSAQLTAKLVHIQSREVLLSTALLQSKHYMLKPSLHGRELTSLVLLQNMQSEHGQFELLATASEDTTVNLVLCHSSNPSAARDIQSVTTMQGHISNVKCLTCVQQSMKTAHTRDSSSGTFSSGTSLSGTSLSGTSWSGTSWSGSSSSCTSYSGTTCDESRNILLFSGGGRAQLCAWKVPMLREIQGGKVQYESLGTHMLCGPPGRLNNKPWNKKRKSIPSNPETRYMDLSAFSLIDVGYNYHSLYMIAAACSDAYVRLFLFDEQSKSFLLISQSDFHNRCVLKITHTTVQSGASNHIIICSTGTDGRLVYWNVTQILHNLTTFIAQSSYVDLLVSPDSAAVSHKHLCLSELIDWDVVELPAPTLILSAHQSGVNALHYIKCHDKSYLYGSGGDDNSLSIHQIKIRCTDKETDSETVKMESIHRWQHLTAHCTEITGLQFLSDTLVASVSIDRRLCIWRMSPHSSQLQLVRSEYLNVADISDMTSWNSDGNNSNFAVSGVGLQMIHYDGDS